MEEQQQSNKIIGDKLNLQDQVQNMHLSKEKDLKANNQGIVNNQEKNYNKEQEDINEDMNTVLNVEKKNQKLDDQIQVKRRLSIVDNKSTTSSLQNDENINNEQSPVQISCSKNTVSHDFNRNIQQKDYFENCKSKSNQYSQNQINKQHLTGEQNSSQFMNQLNKQISNMSLSNSEYQQENLQKKELQSNLNKCPNSLQKQQTNNNKFHFNKENYFDFLVTQQDLDSMNVQSTIEKYNSFTEQFNKKGQQLGNFLLGRNISLTSNESTQDLLSLIFCQNQQQLPFTFDMPSSITKFWQKENCISTEKIGTIGLEKSISEKFINSRKDTSSSNSSDNLVIQNNNNDCSSSITSQMNYHLSSKPTNYPSISHSQIKELSSFNLSKKQSIQSLTVSNQQNVSKSPTLWKSESTQSYKEPKQICTTNTNNNKKNRTCNCKKTKCLKLYCDCFAVGELCGLDCKCVECCNNDASLHLRNQAIESILERNPFAFNVKPDEMKKLKKEQINNDLQNSSSKTVGCNCRKSNCLKKYCLCYQSGLKCSEACKCTECKNLENGLNSPSGSQSSSSIHLNQNQVNLTAQQTHQTSVYNQQLQYQGSSFCNAQLNNFNIKNKNKHPLKIVDGFGSASKQKSQYDKQNTQCQQFENQYEEEERENQTNKVLNTYNNILMNAISQFNLNLQDMGQGDNNLDISPPFSHPQSQVRKKLFLNNSGQTTPVSHGGLSIQNQQTHLNMQNINNIFSLIKNISNEQYE